MPIALVAVVGFGLILAWLVLFGMHRSINDWLLPWLTSLAHPHGSFLTRTALKAATYIGGGVLWILNRVDHAITKAASHSTAAVAHWFHGIASWITHVFSAAETFAVDVEHAIGRIVHHAIPHAIHVATVPLWRGIDHLERDFHHLRERLRAFQRGIDTLIAHRILPAIRHLEHAVAVTIPRDIGRLRHRVREVETQLSKPSRAWLRRLALLLWAAGLFGLVVRTLARRFPWLFCRNTKSFGNNLCRINPNLLGSLFADAIILSGTYSLVAFATEIVKVTAQVENAIVHLFRELDAPIQDYLGPNAAETLGLGTILSGGFSDYLD